jgi:RNA polymerase sigma-70 factor (ECF subfamily)
MSDERSPSPADASDFRALTFSIAYRMLGSVAEAEDVVQEAFLRFHSAQTEGVKIESPKAYLATVTTRLAIDHLRSARVRRESYVGTWLPEPVLDHKEPSMVRQTELAESLSMAFLLILEALSPVERAAFLLREVFDYDYEEISQIVEKTEDNCRQIFARAKRHIEAGKPRFEASLERRDDLARRFFSACQAGDLHDLLDLLATDAAFFGDGGGKATAILQPVHGRDRVAKLLCRPMVLDAQDRLINVLALDVAEGAIRSIRSVVNPEKLQHLGPLSDLTRLPLRGNQESSH